MHPRREELAAYLEGSLPAPATQAVEQHLHSCPACDATVDMLSGATDTVVEKLRHSAALDSQASEEARDPACQAMVEVIKEIGRDPSLPAARQPAVAVPDAPELGSLREYKLLVKLGEGGMGAVYKALHTRLDKVVALKVLPADRTKNADALARFDREMRAVGKLHHPNIVGAHDAGEANGTHFLVMELVDGQDLSTLVKRHGTLARADACELVRQAAVGLQEAFEHGMVHRDIKPSNLMLTVERRKSSVAGIVKILDMGLALLDSSQPGAGDLTGTGQLMGTVNYMAPEQATDTHAVDIRADIYALGGVLYELLTGQIPLERCRHGSVVSKLMTLVNEPNRSLGELRPDLPVELIDLVDRMLARNPDDRPATPEAVAAALESLAAGHHIADLLGESTAPPARVGSGRSIEPPPDETAKQASGEATMLLRKTAPGARPCPDDSTPAMPAWRLERVSLRKLTAIAAGLGGLALVAAVILYFQTPSGTLRVEISDPSVVEVRIKGTDLVFKNGEKEEVQVAIGGKTLVVKRDDFSFETSQLILKQGETTTVTIELLPGHVQAVADGEVVGKHPIAATKVAEGGPPRRAVAGSTWKPTSPQQSYLESVSRLPLPIQIESVSRKLQEINGSSSELVLRPKEGPPTSCRVGQRVIYDIWPLAALPSITSVDLTDTRVVDFRPLARLPLTEVRIKLILDNVTSEEALKSMATLKKINDRPVADYWAERAEIRADVDKIAALAAEMPIADRMDWFRATMRKLNPESPENFVDAMTLSVDENLRTLFRAYDIDGGPFDFSPVRALAMDEFLFVSHTVDWFDLSPLAATKLKKYSNDPWRGAGIRDLTPLAGHPLTDLNISICPVSDLGPLAGMKLKALNCSRTSVKDISVLKGMPLRKLMIQDTQVADLGPLAGMELESFNCFRTPVADISPLKGHPLQELDIWQTRVIDITALKDMPLERLRLGRVRDISVLEGLPLKELEFHFRLYFEPDEKLIRNMALEKINGMAPAEFWKDVENRRQADAEVIAWMGKVPLEEEALKKAIWEKVGQYPPVKIVDGAVVESGVNDGNGARDCYAAFLAFPKLRKLTLNMAPADFSPLLKLANLEELECPIEAVAYNLPVLKLMPHLKIINGKPAREALDQ